MKTCRNFLFHRRVRKQIARELLDGELIERLIAVEGFDDPITVVISARPDTIDLVTGAVGITSKVQPVPAPPFAKVWRGEQPINELLVGVGTPVGHESIDLLRIGRQAQKIEREPANQCGAVSLGRRLEALPLQPRENKVVDRVTGPGRIFHARWNGPHYRLKRPMRGLGDRVWLEMRKLHRPGCAGVDPLAKTRHLSRSEEHTSELQ